MHGDDASFIHASNASIPVMHALDAWIIHPVIPLVLWMIHPVIPLDAWMNDPCIGCTGSMDE